MKAAYYRLIQLPEDTKEANKIRSKKRLDCIAFNDQIGNYKGLTNFVNSKGQLFLYKTECRQFVETDSKRIAEWSLTGNGLNLSSIYIEDLEFSEIGYGYPNANRLLKDGSNNPMFEFRNDGYLFLLNKDFSEIEIIIIPDARNMISSHYQKLIDGGYDDQIREMKKQAIPFYQYEGLVL